MAHTYTNFFAPAQGPHETQEGDRDYIDGKLVEAINALGWHMAKPGRVRGRTAHELASVTDHYTFTPLPGGGVEARHLDGEVLGYAPTYGTAIYAAHIVNTAIYAVTHEPDEYEARSRYVVELAIETRSFEMEQLHLPKRVTETATRMAIEESERLVQLMRRMGFAAVIESYNAQHKAGERHDR